MGLAVKRTTFVHEHDRCRVIVRNGRQATSHPDYEESTDKCHAQCHVTRYSIGSAEAAATSACKAGSRCRRSKSRTTSSTSPAFGRGKMNKYLGPFPAAGENTRVSERKFLSREKLDFSRSIARASPLPRPLLPTKMTPSGSSFLDTRAHAQTH